MRKRRIYIPNMPDTLKRMHQVELGGVSHHAHDNLHGPMIFTYQTEDTLNTNAGPGLRLPRGGELTRIAGRVAGAPSSTAMKIDVLAGGVSIFESSSYLQIPVGEKITKEKIVERAMFSEDTVFTVQVNTISSATGPLVMTFEFMPEY